MKNSAIKDKAEKLLRDACIWGKFPVSLDTIAKHLGYSVSSFIPKPSSANISGAVSSREKKILINDTEPFFRQRFTLAHEFGHIVLHFDGEEGEFVDYRINGNRTTKELEADEFAGCLLMPEDEFRKYWNSSNGNANFLSEYFGVSKPAIGMRAVVLGLG